MPNMDGSSTLEGPSVAEEASIDSNTSIQTNQTISPSSNQQLGFCYSCNRNSFIDTSNYSCASCSSGFVELLVEEDSNAPNHSTTSPDQDSLFERPFLRLINLGRSEATSRLSNLFTDLNENPILDPSSTASGSQESFFSRFRSLRDRQPGFRFRSQADADHEDESSRSSSSSSRRRSRSPPILARTSSRPFSRTRYLSLFDDDSNMFIDYGAVVITTLINQLRNRGAAPASESQIQNLPVVLVDQKLIDESSQCAVCMDDFTINEQIKKLPCKHLFHDTCIATWLKLHATCPVCRNNINGEDATSSNSPANILNEPNPAFFNIIPFPPDETIAISNSTSSGSLNTAQSTLRRNSTNPRNQSLYRIHIRPRLINPGVSQMTEPNNDEPVSRLRSGIRIRTHLSSDSQTEANETNRQSNRLNFGQMVHQFISRHPNDDTVSETEPDPGSSIRITSRLAQSTNSDQRSRYSNVMNYLINQIQERSSNVNRSEDNFLENDVIEIEQDNNQGTDADESNQAPSDDLPTAKRRRV